jgi:hypothetical protein
VLFDAALGIEGIVGPTNTPTVFGGIDSIVGPTN